MAGPGKVRDQDERPDCSWDTAGPYPGALLSAWHRVNTMGKRPCRGPGPHARPGWCLVPCSGAAALKFFIVSKLGALCFPFAPDPVGPAHFAAAQELTPRQGLSGSPGSAPACPHAGKGPGGCSSARDLPSVLGRGEGLPGRLLKGLPLTDNHQLGAESFHLHVGIKAGCVLWRVPRGGQRAPAGTACGLLKSGRRRHPGHIL